MVGGEQMEQVKQVKEVKEVKRFNLQDFKKRVEKQDYNDYDFKNDYVLSIRLSYGEEKQKGEVYQDYIKFLKEDLKVINEKNEINIKSEKSSSYYFIFKKSSDFNYAIEQIKEDLKTNKNDKLQDFINCYEDLKLNNFTIANFKEKKNKIKNFISDCLDFGIIEK